MKLSPQILVPRLSAKANGYVQDYFNKHLKDAVQNVPADRAEARAALEAPCFSAQVFFGLYAFARAGAEQANYGRIASKLLKGDRNLGDGAAFMEEFRAACKSGGVGVNERLNAGVVKQGYQMHFGKERKRGWLFELGERMAETGLVRPAYLELLAIPGIGHKIAALVCRDLAWIFGCEDRLPAGERVLLQPVDTWIRQIAVLLWPEFAPVENRGVDFLIAAQIVSAAERLGQSGVAFNQGSWYFGSRIVGANGNLQEALLKLQNQPDHP
jgi:GNAT superfamily N-acetyltransferase